MIAYHFPPLAGSSGIQRTLRFVQQLPQQGWQPVVLSAHPRAYERTDSALLADVPESVPVVRAQAFDAARHFALWGRYPGALARPDRWMSWRFDAVRQGLALIKAHRPAAIWSTYPIATAHAIAAELAQRSGLPWIADFRDPMAQEGYPADPAQWRSFDAIESRAFALAQHCVLTTPGAERLYRERYPSAAAKICRIENGYDEDTFAKAESRLKQQEAKPNATPVLLHSGIVYPDERNPTQLFEALGRLRALGAITPGDFKIRFRAAVHDGLLRRLAAEHKVEDFVEIAPPIPYADALSEMLQVAALVIMQSSNCNDQVPAKVYEYLRARRPVLALTDPQGDTAAVARASGIEAIVPLNDTEALCQQLPVFLRRLRDEPAALVASEAAVSSASRTSRTRDLAALLDTIA